MNDLRFTLLSDGSSDKALLPILSWVLRACGVRRAIQPEWADLRRLRKPPGGLPCRIQVALDLYPCDLLFVHRDAETTPHRERVSEILTAVRDAAATIGILPPAVCVVPVRMMEAWLLVDEVAIRSAAGNPRGRQPLRLPRLESLEQQPDPKSMLHKVLREASGLSGRRRGGIRVGKAVHRVAELAGDFTPLRTLPAFAALEEEVERIVTVSNWKEP